MKDKKKLWLATEFFYPEYSAATGYFLTGIAERLSQKYNISVVCASPHVKNGKKIRTEQWKSISINRLRGGQLDKNNLILRTIKFLYFAIQFFIILLLKCKKNDNLCVVTNPAPIVIIGAVVSKFKKLRFSIIVHDIFPENMVGANIITSNSLLYKTILPIFNWAYNKADVLVSMGNDMTNLLAYKLPDFNGIVEMIPNWADTDFIKEINKKENSIIQNLHLKHKTVFTFAGNIGRAQGIPELLSNIENLSSNNACFLFFGSGALLNKVIEAQEECKNIHYCGSFPRSQKNLFLSACDIAIISLAKGMTGLGVPSKTYDYLAAGRPIFVIADVNSEISQLVINEKVGWVCTPESPQDFAKNVNHIISNPQEVKEFQRNSREVALKSFSKEIILSKYLKTI